MNTTFASFTIDAETVSDITSLPAELQHLAWSLLARYGLKGEIVDWTTTDSTLAYVSGALSRARQRIDAHRTAPEQTTTPTTTPTPAQTAQPTIPTQVTAPVTTTPTLAAAVTPETTATAMMTPEEMAEIAKTPEEMKALQRALTPAPVHMSLYGGPTLEEVKAYWTEKGYKGDGMRFWIYYEARSWICKGSKVRKWWLVANSFGSGEKSSYSAKKSTPAKAPAAPAVTQTQPQTQTVPPANEIPFEESDLFKAMTEKYDGNDDTDTDLEDAINGAPECYEIDDLLNDMDNDTETPENANPNILLGSGTAQTGMTPDGHTFEVDPSDDDLPF